MGNWAQFRNNSLCLTRVENQRHVKRLDCLSLLLVLIFNEMDCEPPVLTPTRHRLCFRQVWGQAIPRNFPNEKSGLESNWYVVLQGRGVQRVVGRKGRCKGL